ncbi:ACE1 transcription factor [Coprinopsis cinerea AmutBmut pab1-1]|nr:ACE1 transcription factor [Coprinopsis cinerea AmutBmut pab1-1]
MIISDKKYACETCIKGHRSSSCKHYDRPLFEIKKKGRPITQCEHCRELRKTKQVHVKCICEGKADQSNSANKKGTKSGFESAAFPNGLPLQAAGTLVALQPPPGASTKLDAENGNGKGGCSCKTGAACNCCTPKKSQRRTRTSSSANQHRSASASTAPDSRVLARVAELRPVLPGPPPHSDFYLYGAGSHDPSLGNHHHHNYPRHHENVYSPYSRAYNVHQHSSNHPHSHIFPYTSPDVPRVNSASPSLDTNMDSTRSQLTIGACICGDGCGCRGCQSNTGGTNENRTTCTNPEGCASCIDCALNTFQPIQQPLLTHQLASSSTEAVDSIDDWLRSLSTPGPDTGPSTGSGLLNDLIPPDPNANSGLDWDADITSLMRTTATATTADNAQLSSDYSSIAFPSGGDGGLVDSVDFDVGSPSIFRLSRSSSHGSAAYGYLDPGFMQNLRFDGMPSSQQQQVNSQSQHEAQLEQQLQQQRSRSHSPSSSSTMSMTLSMGALQNGGSNGSASSSSSSLPSKSDPRMMDFVYGSLQVPYRPPGRIHSPNHSAGHRPSQSANQQLFANVAGIRSAPQLILPNHLNHNTQLSSSHSSSVSPVGNGNGIEHYAISNPDSDGSINSLRDTAIGAFNPSSY